MLKRKYTPGLIFFTNLFISNCRTLIEERARNARAWKSRKNVRTADGDFDRFWDLDEVFGL
jgi:hypothetical protein